MRRRATAVLPLLLAGTLAACTANATAQGPGPAPDPNRSDWPDQATLIERAVAARDLGMRAFPASYAGEKVDNEGGRVLLYRVPDAGYDRALQTIPLVLPVDVPHSATTLDQWQTQIVADLPLWEKRGIPLHQVGPAPAEGCITVSIDNPTRDGATVTAHYPTATLCIVQGSRPDHLVP